MKAITNITTKFPLQGLGLMAFAAEAVWLPFLLTEVAEVNGSLDH